MNISNVWVDFREGFMAALLGYRLHTSLNDGGNETIDREIEGPEIAVELKQAIISFKSQAMDEEGKHVEYSTLAESEAYLNYREQCSPMLRGFDPSSLGTEQEKLAFWIDLYNVLVIDAVIRFQVRDSVTEGFLGVLKFFKKAAYNVGGVRITLDDIEHGILRTNRGNPYIPGPQFRSDDPRLDWMVSQIDPRIHFALNCASRSCPPIGVYSADRIDEQLDLAARNFIHQEVTLDRMSGVLEVSKIFQWYRRDFGGDESIADFIQHYLTQDDRSWLNENQEHIELQFKSYDWKLNV